LEASMANGNGFADAAVDGNRAIDTDQDTNHKFFFLAAELKDDLDRGKDDFVF
jgi:hypothetical protein